MRTLENAAARFAAVAVAAAARFAAVAVAAAARFAAVAVAAAARFAAVAFSAAARFAAITLAAALGLSATACGPDYDHTDVGVVTTSFNASTNQASEGHITLTEGSILVVHLVVWNDDDEHMPVRFEVTDQSKIDFLGVVNTTENYAVVGKAVGSSAVKIIADDEQVLTINVDVVAQPAPP